MISRPSLEVHIFLPALLQKLVGDFFLIFRREIWKIQWEIWREFSGDFFLTHRTKAQKIRGKFRSIFRKKIRGSKKIFRAKFTLQTCHLNIFLELGDGRLSISYATPTKGFRSESGIFRGWCTNCHNLREQQDFHHPQDRRGDVQHGFCGCGARIVGLEERSTAMDSDANLLQKEYPDNES